MQDNKELKRKEFGLSTWSVNNAKTVFLIAIIIVLAGITSYVSMPKENFPELVIPEVYASTPVPGNNSEYIEKKITDGIENEINSIKNVDKITSTTVDGYSAIKIEFDFSVSPDKARQKVQDAVKDARAKPEFPQLQFEPKVIALDISDAMPIMNVNLRSEDYDADRLEDYAEILKKRIKALPQISDVVIRGVPEKKVKIEMNNLKMSSLDVSPSDIENAVKSENVNLPSGEILYGGRKISAKIDAEFKDYRELDSIIVKAEEGNEIYLCDVAEVSFGKAEEISFAREFSETVVMLDIKKRAGENLLDAASEIHKIVEARKGIPQSVNVSITNDQSYKTKDSVSNLENSIIFGVILVVLVLLFFLGLRNALFVGIAIPLSMFMSFMLLQVMGVTLNIMVLFSLVLALGMLVDNGIVVVENIYRFMDEGYDGMTAAKKGVGEVAWPIIASTATTLAAFIPLAFWPGIMGEFMKYLPITLMIVLGSSLFVALVINPVFTAAWMKIEEKTPNKKRLLIVAGISIILGVVVLAGGTIVLANILFFIALMILLNMFVFRPGANYFQNVFLPKLEKGYYRFLSWAMKGKKPVFLLIGTFLLFIVSNILISTNPPNTLFFPVNQPNYLNVFIEHPVGTDIHTTNETAQKVYNIIDTAVYQKYEKNVVYEKELDANGKEIEKAYPLISSIVSQVGKGTSDPAQGQEVGESPHKARITMQFAEFIHREGKKTSDIETEVRDALRGQFPAGVRVIVDKNQDGPPRQPPINIELKGPGNYDQTLEYADSLRKFLIKEKNSGKYGDTLNGIIELRLDVEMNKLELPIELDREALRKKGTSTYQVADLVRTALFGKDISTFAKDGENYDINIRMKEFDRNNLDVLLNQEISFRNTRGQFMTIPIKSIVKSKKPTIYSTYGSVKRKNLEQVVTIFSKLEKEDEAEAILGILARATKAFEKTRIGKQMLDDGYEYKFTGEAEEMEKQMAFLSKALLIAVFLILLIIVTQFNSFSTPSIILVAVVFSLIGVLLGLLIFNMDFVIIMTMIGIISLAGVVVNNAIVLIDYTNLIRKRKREELGISGNDLLPMNEVINSVIEGGKTRLRPVLLTAITTVLGLIPLATGLNINFVTFFTDYDPQIFIGGDNVIFFGPMSWTIIFGLTFATFLTLVIVPVTYLLLYRFKVWLYGTFNWEIKPNK